jgi:membrane associated rhomboid family serine protease
MSSSSDPRLGSAASSSFSDPRRPGPLDTDVAVGLLKRAQALAEQGDWDLAAGTFARVVGHADPALHTAALLGLAECRYRLDEDAAALQAWITATQAPENELSWRAWKALAIARVRESDNVAAARAYREAARRAPASEQAEIQSRIGWLSKELGDERSAQQAFGRSRTDLADGPVVTYAIIGVTVAIGLVALMGVTELQQLLALDKAAVFHDSEYWRLFTVAQVHDDNLPIHLLFNMYALWIIGPLMEGLYGPRRFLFIYLVCVAAGSAASFATSPYPGVGASGGVFGLFGALLVADRVHKPAMTRNARNLTMQIGLLIGINLLIGFSMPNIDNAAHIGGLVAGAALGFLLVPQGARLATFWGRGASDPVGGPGTPGARTDPSRPLRLAGVAGLLVAIAAVVLVSPVTYEPLPDLFWRAGEPAAVAEAVGDAVGVPTGQSGVDSGQLGRAEGIERQHHEAGAAGLARGALVAEEQTEPGSHAAGQLQVPVDGAARDGIRAPERVAA